MKQTSTYKAIFLFIIAIIGLNVSRSIAQSGKLAGPAVKTFCNPINLPYNFQTPDVTRREAADPVIVLYHNKYWLFASKQIGYWWSDDLLNWNLIKPTGLPLEIYAPSVAVIDDRLCYTAGNNGTFTTDDPIAGKWININPYKRGQTDPAVFQDSDGKVYLYDGCSDRSPLRVTELDRKTFLPLTEKQDNITADVNKHGWEVAGDNNRGRTEDDLSAKSVAPWVEGSWMNKINGKYYWQYSAPGTQFKTYADGVYVSDKPTGPFVYQPYSPFSFKPTGFIAGAGHSATFADKTGEYWHISTGTISVRHSFERRLVLFPAAVLNDGQLVANTYLGDYPQYAPGTAEDHLLGNTPKWMLISYNKKATASSTLAPIKKQTFDVKNAFDEDIRTWWSAATGNKGEWLQVDLEKKCRINAVQVNFADQGAKQQGSLVNDGYQYEVAVSTDGKKWNTVIDRRGHGSDAPHDYVQLDKPVFARYVRITNFHAPANGLFSIYDLRVFGSALGSLPLQVKTFTVQRDHADQRRVHLTWKATPNTDFYIVRYGIAPGRLFGNYQVYDANKLDINALNVGVSYYFTVDAVNGTGITPGKSPLKAE
jgi:xylan 1,4-beta-xylosidase